MFVGSGGIDTESESDSSVILAGRITSIAQKLHVADTETSIV